MKTAFIINPAAGRGKTKKLWPVLRNLLIPETVFEEHYTTGHGHASNLAGVLENKGINRIVIVGGDGTLHEVINGLKRKEAVIGVIPTGTGNDFCRSIGIPADPRSAIRTLSEGRIRKLDLGCVNNRFFINVAGVGFDAHVAQEINKGIKWLTGSPAYLVAVLKLIMTYRNIPLQIILDNNTKIHLNSFLLAVGNAQYYGGGMRIVPSAVPDDGYFHICAAGDVRKRDVLITLPKIFSGKHMDHPLVRGYTAKEIEISSDCRAVVHADGEIIGHLPAKFSILPRELKLLVPDK